MVDPKLQFPLTPMECYPQEDIHVPHETPFEDEGAPDNDEDED